MWARLWKLLPETAVFLVAMISVSRLLLLIRPTTQYFTPRLGWILPTAYFCLNTALKCIFALAGMTESTFKAPTMSCGIRVIMNHTETGNVVTQRDWNQLTTVNVLSSIQIGMPVVPISVSFLLSLYYFARDMRSGKALNCSVVKQVQATKTVIIITLVYVICNIPMLGQDILHTISELGVVAGETEIGEIKEATTRLVTSLNN